MIKFVLELATRSLGMCDGSRSKIEGTPNVRAHLPCAVLLSLGHRAAIGLHKWQLLRQGRQLAGAVLARNVFKRD